MFRQKSKSSSIVFRASFASPMKTNVSFLEIISWKKNYESEKKNQTGKILRIFLPVGLRGGNK